MAMSFWDIIDAHMDEYGVTEAAIARKAAMSEKTLNSWRKRGIPRLPERADIAGIAAVTRQSYTVVLDAILHDTGYLAESEGVVTFEPARHQGRRGA